MALRLTSLIAVVLVSLFTLDVAAGKLGSVRNRSRSSRPKQTASDNSNRESDRSREREEQRREEQQAEDRRESNQRSSHATPSPGKLASVRERTRQNNEHRPSPPPRRAVRPRGRRPRRSVWAAPTFGVQFDSRLPYDSCAPAIVEEHHYYGSPAETWVVTEPVPPAQFGVPIPAPATALPPVMPGEPTVKLQIEDDLAGPPIVGEQSIICEPETICEDTVFAGNAWTLEPFQIRFEIDYAGDEADVSRMGFGLLLNATNGLGIDTGARLFRERGADLRDHMWVGDFNVTYELIASKRMRTRAGIGFNFLSDAYGGDAGLNLTLGSDLFLGPVTLTGEVDLGTIGHTDLFHGRLSAAILCSDHLETFVGYDHLDIGGVEFSGLLAGIRFRY